MGMSNTQYSNVTQEKNRVQENGSLAADPRVAFFNHQAGHWDDDAHEVAQTVASLEALRDRLGLSAGQDVLEMGCGTGRITGWLAKTVSPGRVVAADFSPGMLEQAKKRELPVEFRLMDICGEVFPLERFDTVFCFHSFPHFRDQPRALQNMSGLLKPGGRLIVLHLASSVELNDFHGHLSHPICHDYVPPKSICAEMLAAAGLRMESFTDEPGLFLLVASA